MAPELVALDAVGYAYPGGRRLAERIPALRRAALEDVTVSVAAGERVALLGGNGAGKSTLLQLCNGLLEPDHGEVRWLGAPPDRSRRGLARWRMEAGFLFQDPDDQLFSGTLLDDVSFGPLNQGLGASQVREIAMEALDRVGLADFADLPPHVLSHGMRKRVALAGVLALRPRLLLLDEPTAGLDRKSEEDLLLSLERLTSEGAAVILSTHDLDLAAQWARRAVVLSEGRLVHDGQAREFASNDDLLAECGFRRRTGRPATGPGVRSFAAKRVEP